MDNLIDINELSRAQIEDLFDLTERMKRSPRVFSEVMAGRTLIMLFAKPSTRTRLSFESGTTMLGGHAIFLAMEHSQLGRGEPISDTARVMSRYADLIMARLFDHDEIVDLARYADIPVINGLTDYLHPCQALGDLYTLHERDLHERVAFVGDGNNNVTHSLMQACAKLGVSCRVAAPAGMQPDQTIRDRVKDADVLVTEDPYEAVEGATAVYTDVFVSMGEEEQRAEILEALREYQVDQALMEAATEDAVFMHCLPAHRGEEVSADVFEGPQSIVFDQAENRMHVQNAIMLSLVRG